MEPVTLFITTLGAAAGKATTAEGFKLVRQLIGLQEDQIALLQRINVKVDALLAGPFNTGCRQLIDAMSADRQPTDRTELLKEARVSFTQALGQDTEPMRRSLAAIHLATVWLALGSPDDARRCLREAHLEALRAVVIKQKYSLSERYLGDPRDRYHKFIERIDLANAIYWARSRAGDQVVYPFVISRDPPPPRLGMQPLDKRWVPKLPASHLVTEEQLPQWLHGNT